MLPLAAAGDPLPDPVCSELYHGQRVRHHYTSIPCHIFVGDWGTETPLEVELAEEQATSRLTTASARECQKGILERQASPAKLLTAR
jgi:hypothetical protein